MFQGYFTFHIKTDYIRHTFFLIGAFWIVIFKNKQVIVFYVLFNALFILNFNFNSQAVVQNINNIDNKIKQFLIYRI